MSVVLNVEFTEFFSSNCDNDEIEITYKIDDKTYYDKFPNCKGNVISLSNIKKDTKISIKVQKENNVIGTGELNLFQSIHSKEKSIHKWIGISPLDIKKSSIMSNTLNNMMKINTKISISYLGNLKAQQGSDETYVKKDSAVKINSANSKTNTSNTSNKKMLNSSKRTNSVNTNNNNSTVHIDYKNKSMMESDLKMNTINTSSNMSEKSKNGNTGHLVINTFSHTHCISGKICLNKENVTPNNKAKKGKNMLMNSTNKCNMENLLKTTNDKNEKIKLQRKASSEKEEIILSKVVINDKPGKSIINTPVNKDTPILNVPNLDLDEENENKEIDQDKENMSSEASSIINEENTQEQEKSLIEMNEMCEKFSTFYNEFYIENIPDDEFLLQNESTLIMEEMFKLQDHYHQSYNELLNTHLKLREIVIKYNTKYRTTARKNEILKKNIESDSMKKLLNLNINNEENKRIKDMIECLQKEIKMLKIIYRLKGEKGEITNFIEENKKQSEVEKEVLKKSFNNVLNNSKLKDKLPSESKKLLDIYLAKCSSKELIRSPQNIKDNLDKNLINLYSDGNSKKEDSKLNTNQSLNPLENSPLKTIATDHHQSRQSKQLDELNTFSGENFLSFNQNNSDKYKSDLNDLSDESHMYHSNYNSLILTFKKKNDKEEGIKNELEDEFERKLDHYVNEVYSKKKISNVKLKSLGNGEYEFGTQKIKIIMESDGFKVKNGNTYIPLSKYIESNANTEELKSLKNNSLFGHAKGGKKQAEHTRENQTKSSNNSTKLRTTTPTNMKKLLK